MSRTTHKLKHRFAEFWWGDRGISAFLLLLFAALFLAPFFESKLLSSLSEIFFSLLLISGVAYISPRPLLRRLTGLVAFTTIVLHWLLEFHPGPGLAIASRLLTLLFLIAMTLVMLIRVFGDTSEVTASRVRGAVAAYLLFGITWSILYQLLNLCLPAPFSISATAMTPNEQKETFAYFSFVTLTTLGYGDITAIHPIARMFVIFEGLVGQLYPATLLARLVSLELSGRQQGDTPSLPPNTSGTPGPHQHPASNVPRGE